LRRFAEVGVAMCCSAMLFRAFVALSSGSPVRFISLHLHRQVCKYTYLIASLLRLVPWQ
jgi:hypothetical protein